MQQSPHRFILSGGGTGGHIFPAIAIADEIRLREPDARILFIGAKGRMEMEKVPAAGYEIKGLWISGLQRRLSLKNLSFPFKVLSSLINARKIVGDFKPHIVIGTGGYASGPTLRAAAAMGYPTLIQEQNSYPGITNKLLSKKADHICVAYEGLEKWFPAEKITITGNPVRKDLLDLHHKKETAQHFFSLDPAKKTVLVIGGSLGALTINESISNSLELLEKNNIQLIWQTGKTYYPIAENLLSHKTEGVFRVYPFITAMDMAYAAADIIVSRAGAIAISELCITGKPSILVPSPNVAEDHQPKNAMTLVKNDAAMLITDAESRQKLVEETIKLLNDEFRLNVYKSNISRMAIRNSDEIIAKEIIAIAKK